MDRVFFFLLPYLPFVLLLVVGLVAGSMAANRHERDLEAREAALADMLLTNLAEPDGRHAALVSGSTVIAYDFFRRLAVVLRKIVGGRFGMHERMMARARREAVLRMAEEAKAKGADAVHNIRLISSNLGANDSAMGGCEVLAYGTAVWE